MSTVTVGILGTGNISQSGTDSVSFLGVGTLNIAGTAQSPITVVLSSVAGAGLLDTINITNADVTLNGVAGLSALAAYNVGAGGTLRLQSSIGIAAGTTITFNGANSHLVVGNGVNLSLIGAINGFGPGSNIDLSATGFASYTYSDNAGTGTGGTLTLLDANGNATGSVALNTGEFTASSFYVHPDGNGGTLIDFGTYVSSISATPPNADLTVGGSVVLHLALTAPVTITGGTPSLTLNDGGIATYDAAHSTSTNLAFNYTVQAGQNTADLAITGTSLNGASATDMAGNAVTLAGAIGNPAGTLQIDTTAPTITGIATTPGSGSLAVGQVVAISLTPSEAVTVAGGTPTLALNNGGTATYDPTHSTATNLVFNYTVQSGQNTADLTVTGTSLNGATITDGAGNAANLTGAIGNPAGTLQIDTVAPTITGIATTPGSGAFGAGQVVAISLTPSEAVTVSGGTPTLTLNDGGPATYNAAGSTATNLVFNYTVQPGQNTADLTVTGTNLNGATIADAAGNAANLTGAVGNPAGILQIDTTAPTITAIATTPGSGDLAAGQVVAISLTPSEAVTVTGGLPTLTLNDGGTATYDAVHSTATNLMFNYIVQPGQNTADLTVTGSTLNGATITDAAGNAAILAGAIGNPAGILQIDTTAPTITAIATTPGSGALAAGQVVAISLTPSEAVTVSGGTPALMLNDGGMAVYDAVHSTATNLVFNYTVQPGQNTADLTVTGSTLNGATITDAAGNAASLIGAIGNPAGTLQIDTIAPTITAIATTPGNGSLAVGQVVAISLTPSEAVTVTGGTPTLTLNDGGTATYDAGSSTPTHLVFNYTVQPGQNATDLAVTGSALNGATIADAAGNPANLTGAIGNPTGTLQIDTVAPTITAIATIPGSGAFGAGQVVAISLTPSEAVTVSGGTPTLTLNDGGTATYDATHSTATNLVFNYTVQPGQNTADLTVTGTNLNGATIADAAGNAANLTGAVGNPAGILQIDTTAPTITALATTPGSGALAAGQVVAISLTSSEAVTVTGGPPTLTLNDGGTAVYDAVHSTATNLVFNYTVQPGQNTADLTITGAALNGATITDPAGNAASLAGAIGNPAGTLQIDTTAPTITAIATTPGNGALAAGQVVAISLTPSEAVTVSGGTPTLTLNDGGNAIYDAAHSTATNLVFNYTVQPGQNTADLTVTGSALNGATIADAAGNAASLIGAIGNPAGILQIDTTAPTITAIATTPGSGSLAVGQVVAISLTPSEAVTVTGGTPTLTLNDGGTATYDDANSTPTNLVFDYTVQPGQNATDLAITGSALNGATIADAAGNPANLTGAIGNPAGILQIDTTAATITGISTTPGSGSLRAGQVVAITLTTSEAVTVQGGTPTLTLNDGRTAIYDTVNSTATTLAFSYTVQPGDNTADLTVTGTNLNGAIIADAAGNPANLGGAVGNPPGILQIDTTPPTITAIATTPSSGTLAAGQVVTINLTPSEAVTVTGGTPTLTLDDGGTAIYDAISSTATNLVFRYVVQPGDASADLNITGINQNGTVIADLAGNPANLTGAVGNPPGTLQIDTTLPPVTSVFDVMTTPGSGDLGAGSTVALQIVLTGNVTVSGGTPTLTLSDGGVATYDPGSSTAGSLVFRHTIQPGQNTADLTVTAVALNGATVIDGSGHAVDLSGAVTNPGGILQVDTTAPTISAVTTSPGAGSLGAGQIVAINVATSEAVTVSGGIPTLTLNDGGTAIYDALNSTATNLVFKYAVQPGQNTADLTVTGSTLNGATIADGAGNALNLAGSIGNPPGTLQIDTTAPTVIAVATQPGTGTLTAGQVVTISVSPSEAVAVNGGTPTLTLDDGGVAVYDAANSTPTNLVFKYTVQAGQNTADLAVTGSNLNGATITDPAGNPLDLTGVVGNPAGTLTINTVPVVTGVTVTPLNADLTVGGSIVLQVNTSGPTTVTGGTPTLLLSDGGTAVYDAASSTPTSLVFRNTVQAGQNSPDVSVAAAFLNGAAISDGFGHTVSLSGAVGNPAGVLQVDTTAPTIVNMVFGGSDAPGGVFTITSYVSEPVTVSGGPFMYLLANGGTANYDPLLSTPTALVATYTVPLGSNLTPADLAIVGLNKNGSTAVDGAGNQLYTPSALAAIAAAQGNFSGVTGTGTTTVNPTTIDVYRFFDSKTGTHFYTQDPNERQTVLNTRPDLIPEGPNGVGLTAVDPASNDPNAAPVYRFFDLTQGTHFFTASSAERDTVIATRPDLVYEPASTFYEHIVPQAGDTAVYRFFDTKFGTHFYTDDPAERATIIQTRPDLVQEGVGFYEPARNPSA